MPRQKGTGKGQTERFNIRLDGDTAGFYKTKANEHGISISEFLRQTLVQGVISENVHEIEQRLRRVIAEMSSGQQSGKESRIPSDVVLSVFTSEAMLSAIVEAKGGIQELYAAQDKAKEKLKRLLESGELYGET